MEGRAGVGQAPWHRRENASTTAACPPPPPTHTHLHVELHRLVAVVLEHVFDVLLAHAACTQQATTTQHRSGAGGGGGGLHACPPAPPAAPPSACQPVDLRNTTPPRHPACGSTHKLHIPSPASVSSPSGLPVNTKLVRRLAMSLLLVRSTHVFTPLTCRTAGRQAGRRAGRRAGRQVIGRPGEREKVETGANYFDQCDQHMHSRTPKFPPCSSPFSSSSGYSRPGRPHQPCQSAAVMRGRGQHAGRGRVGRLGARRREAGKSPMPWGLRGRRCCSPQPPATAHERLLQRRQLLPPSGHSLTHPPTPPPARSSC